MTETWTTYYGKSTRHTVSLTDDYVRYLLRRASGCGFFFLRIFFLVIELELGLYCISRGV